MIVTVQVDGGFAFFPKLNAPKTVDTERLPAEEKNRIETLVKEAHVWDISEVLSEPPRHAADVQTFVVTVRDGDRVREVRAAEPVTDAGLASLLDFLLKRSDE